MADIPQAPISFIGKFTVLKGAARELWLMFAVKLLVIAAYAVTNSALVLWLTSDLGFDAVIFGRVMTGGKVDATGSTAP